MVISFALYQYWILCIFCLSGVVFNSILFVSSCLVNVVYDSSRLWKRIHLLAFALTFVLSYIIEERVCYLTICDQAYPKKLAFQYLKDLKNEFEHVDGALIETAARPYAFIKFGRFTAIT
ncbi:putative Longin-like domain-containing protein [Rosa chinensis]|uniref:Putative Longin-like domain-containing protein n=1 Tax=Rosa chinensis TaxID=74649 RepID=A0A2P6SC36_ROSCH|nr:putative Longin-like domain-containing protein [Rosa chinensis]